MYSIAIHCNCSDNEATFVLRFKGKSSESRLPSVSAFLRTEEFQCVYESSVVNTESIFLAP